MASEPPSGNNHASSPTMPELPGMVYDHVRRRYFKKPDIGLSLSSPFVRRSSSTTHKTTEEHRHVKRLKRPRVNFLREMELGNQVIDTDVLQGGRRCISSNAERMVYTIMNGNHRRREISIIDDSEACEHGSPCLTLKKEIWPSKRKIRFLPPPNRNSFETYDALEYDVDGGGSVCVLQMTKADGSPMITTYLNGSHFCRAVEGNRTELHDQQTCVMSVNGGHSGHFAFVTYRRIKHYDKGITIQKFVAENGSSAGMSRKKRNKGFVAYRKTPLLNVDCTWGMGENYARHNLNYYNGSLTRFSISSDDRQNYSNAQLQRPTHFHNKLSYQREMSFVRRESEPNLRESIFSDITSLLWIKQGQQQENDNSHSKLLCGLRNGELMLWDSRINKITKLKEKNNYNAQHGVNSSISSSSQPSIIDIKQLKNENNFIISSFLNHTNNLSMIDLRSLPSNVTASQKKRLHHNSVVTYYGHRNECKWLRFDVADDLVAAGGDDQRVRLWDAQLGGNPLATLTQFDDVVDEIRIGTTDSHGSWAGGLWTKLRNGSSSIHGLTATTSSLY